MISNILNDREKRYHRTLSLIEQYQLPVLCGKINYPGQDKNAPEAQSAFKRLEKLMISIFTDDSMHCETLSGYDGASILMSVDLTPKEAKKKALELEKNHPLGRIFDIDVYIEGGRSIGRSELGLESRKCLLCGGEARLCIREQKHSLEETLEKVNKLIGKHSDRL